MAQPMIIDRGASGLEQSRHHPLAGESAGDPITWRSSQDQESTTDITTPEESIRRIETLLHNGFVTGEREKTIKGVIEIVRTAYETIKQRYRDTHDTPTNTDQDPPLTLKSIQQLIETTVAKSIKKEIPQQQRTWASVAATPSTGSDNSTWQTKAVIPARREKEVIIKNTSQEADMANRSPKQMVDAINAVTKGNGRAVAARRLRSGDTIITFSNAAREMTAGNSTWVQAAFGTTATISRREVAVIAKGLPATKLRNHHDETQLAEALRGRNGSSITKCKRSLPRNTQSAYAALILFVSDANEAKALCENGLLWDCQYFDCEPYEPSLRITQCFRCFEYGHVGRYCAKTARCGHCACVQHEGGEKQCPEKEGSGRKKCVNCSGRHTAFSRDCPVAQKQRERVKEAYAHRPRQFEVRSYTESSGESSTTNGKRPRRNSGQSAPEAAPILERTVLARNPVRGRPRGNGISRGQSILSLQRNSNREDTAAPFLIQSSAPEPTTMEFDS
jgi:hypothetical protein